MPALYRYVHKLHHAHTHDVRLLSALQMTAADVALTHTMPLLGALAVVPLAPGLEMSIAKTYLLFQASAPGICVTGATDVAGVTGVAGATDVAV